MWVVGSGITIGGWGGGREGVAMDKRSFVFPILVTVLVLILVACIVDPTPPVSPLPTPPVSPLAVNRAVGGLGEKSQTISMEENQMSLYDTLGTLAAGGAILGGIIAFLFERFQWFQNLTGEARFWTIGAISVGLPVVATALILYVPADVWVTLEPFWKAVFAGGTIWLGSQIVHKLTK